MTKERGKILLAVATGILMVILFWWDNFFLPAVNYTPYVGTNDLTDANIPYALSHPYFLAFQLSR